MKFKRPDDKPFLVILVKRTISFFFGVCVLLVFVYIVGHRQGFMDTTQLRVLNWAFITGMFLAFVSLCAVFLDLWYILLRKRDYINGIIYYILVGLFGFSVSFLGAFILTITGGI